MVAGAGNCGRSQMLKLTIAVLAVTLAGTASAAGWRSMRLDVAMDAFVVAPQPASQNADGRSRFATHFAQKLQPLGRERV